ncbi:MAG: AAA family ATPase [Methylococcaceae bacterium]|nr:AAA family ATPase [Methylococcaceae bacterium]
MKINKINLINFRCFDKYNLSLSDRFTLLIGDNGSGKTAILDALKISISPFITGLHDGENFLTIDEYFHLTSDDARYELFTLGQNPIKETTNATVIRVEGHCNNRPLYWSVSNKHRYKLDPAPSEPITSYAQHLRISDKSTLLPIICYYSTKRLFANSTKEIETEGPRSRLKGYQDCLSPSFNLEQLFRWFKTQELAALQKQEPRHVLEAVRAAIVRMIPDAKNTWWDVDWDELLIQVSIKGNLQTIPFHLLSDGYRNMIGIVADIAYRMATLNPQLEADAIKKTEGMVLIDELDLHLHPNWQKQVVGRLLDTFPKIQFVATSHSPFIIQSLYHRDDCLLWDLETNAPVTVDSKSIEDIAENQQGVEIPQQSQRFLDMEKAAEEYYTVLKQIPPASEDEKQRLRQRLDELLMPYSDDPAFQAFLKMERLAVEGNKPV